MIIYSIIVDPIESSIFYVTYGNGVIKFLNNGLSFIMLNNGLTTFNVKSLVINPKNNLLMYVGTWGEGMFFTTNGGNTWTKKRTLTSKYINSIVINPLNSQEIFVSTEEDSLLKSSDDGNTWDILNLGINKTAMSTIEVNPYNLLEIYVCTEGEGVFKCFNGGKSWQSFNQGLDNLLINDIAVDSLNHREVYVVTTGEVYKYTDKALSSRIAVNASMDGNNWNGEVKYKISGPAQFEDNYSPKDFFNAQLGIYIIEYMSGGPPNSTLVSISPSYVQNLPGDGIISFTFNFTKSSFISFKNYL